MNYLIFLFTIFMSNLAGQPIPRVTSIIIDKPAHTLYAMTAEGDTVAAYDCALGRNYGQKQRQGDCKTPEGVFKIVSIENSSAWEGDASGSDYGPWFMRLGGATPWHSIGIHGTNKPATVGTRASLGCIRLNNADLRMLHRMVAPGCDVTILPDTITTDTIFPSAPKPVVKAAATASVSKTKSRKHKYHYPVRKHHKRRAYRRHHRRG